MAVQQIPADFPISLVRGDELNFTVRVNADLTGYTITSGVYQAGSGGESIPTDEFAPPLEIDVETVEIDDEEVTRTNILVSFVEDDTETLSPLRAWRWYLRWVSPGGVTRTFVSGVLRSRDP